MTDERKVAGAAVALLAVAATLALAVGTAAAPARPHVSVYFVQGEQLAVDPAIPEADSSRVIARGRD